MSGSLEPGDASVDQQWWHLQEKGRNVTLLNKAGGRAVSIWAGDATNAQRLHLWVDHAATDQEWTLVPSTNGYVKVRSVRNPSLLMTGATQNGAVTVSRSTADGSQDWQLVEDTSTGGGQVAEIRNRHSDLCLDAFERGYEPGAEVRQQTCNGDTVQDWELIPVGGGYHAIRNVDSGLCLDDYEWNTEPGAEVRQWTCNGLSVQQWQIVDTGDGYSNLVNRHSGLCLDDFERNTEPGAEVRQQTCNGDTVQDWLIT